MGAKKHNEVLNKMIMKKHKYGFEHPLTGQIQTAGFYIDFYGDKSVGIYDQKFILKAENNVFTFDQERDVEYFKELIADAFEIVTGERCGVETVEEQGRRLDAEERQIMEADPNLNIESESNCKTKK